MNTLLIYIVKAAVYLIAFYLVYSILLSRDTSYGRNRVFIMLALTSAMILPFFTLQTIKPLNIQLFGKLLSEVFISSDAEKTGILNQGSSALNSLQLIFSIYIFGVLIFAFKLLVDLLNLLFLIVRQKNQGSRIIRFHGFSTAGFSAMGHIFINTRLSPEEAGEVIRHEQNHLKLNHFIDIVILEAIKAVQWFNPVVYMFDRSLRAIHEYQADRGCLISGVPIVNYQSLLLSQIFKSKAFNLTNSFSNPSLIKKRMIMMTKKRTSGLADMKLLMVLPVIGVVFLAISAYKEDSSSSIKPGNVTTTSQSPQADSRSQILPPPPPPPPTSSESTGNTKVVNEKISDGLNDNEPFVVVDEMPMFPGGDPALLQFIANNTKYPESAKENNIQGRVIIRFCVTAEGGVNRISVIKSVAPDLDKEAMRVVESLPSFKPGKQGGMAVPVWYMVPITFTLK